jgi:HNH endonuclease
VATVRERFEEKVEVRDGHLVWTGSCDAAGVPQFRVDGRLTTARRVAWELAHGVVPSAMLVVACAGDRRCVDVAHLSLVDRPRSVATAIAEARVARRDQRRDDATVAPVVPDTEVPLSVDEVPDGACWSSAGEGFGVGGVALTGRVEDRRDGC